MDEKTPPWLRKVRVTGEPFIDDVRHPEIVTDDLFPKHESFVGIARAMRQRESWTRPLWLILPGVDLLAFRGEVLESGRKGRVYADQAHGEISWR